MDLATLTLKTGSHETPDDGLCVMEAVAYVAGEPHSDHPACASPILTDFCINLNDRWDDANRQRLVPFVPRIVGTRDDGKDELRGYLALDWLIRTYTPVWLDLAGLTAEATALRDLRRIVDLAAAQSAGPVVREAGAKAAAAGAAAWDAAGAAAWDAAGAAAWDAAWAAAGAAAGDAAGAAAGDAAWATAGDAAWAVLKPTVETLQASALDLLDRMIDGRWDAAEVTE
jgi:hypothetical protein